MQEETQIVMNKIEGVHGLSLPPATSKEFNVSDKSFVLTIPISGKYSTIAPDLFPNEKDEFCIFDGTILDIPTLSKVLFATRQYPALLANQAFIPTVFKFTDNSVIIVGKVVEYI